MIKENTAYNMIKNSAEDVNKKIEKITVHYLHRNVLLSYF